jgi:hypothetical protein
VTVSPSSSLVAAGMGTGLYLSSDDGRTWTDPNGEGLGTGAVATINAAAFDPQDEATMYASLNACCGVYKTTDGGLHWALTTLRVGDTWKIIVDPTDSETVYAGTGATPYRTIDGGGYWESVHQGIPATLGLNSLAIDPNNPNILFAATKSETVPSDPESGIYRSTDGATTWQRSSEGLVDVWTLDMVVAPSDSQRIYTSSGFVSTDGGASWSPMGMGGYAVAVDPTDALTVYVGTMDEGVSRSRDGGGTWQNMSIGLPIDTTIVAVYSLAVGPGGTVLHAGTTRGVFSYSFSFDDVLPGDLFYDAVRILALNLLTTGCGNDNFCPTMPMTRAQASVLLLRTAHGPDFQPPAATGTVFADVPADAFAADWIEEAASEGITGGCGGGNFCPGATATRAQMAVFLLRAEHGPKYAPPPATGLLFGDVPADAFAAAWIEALANEGIASGCGGGNFCPNDSTSRAQAAALLVRTFGLE